ncbi:MAG: hypothetical protein WD342_02780 [Verrucomicrobiales bacterium]
MNATSLEALVIDQSLGELPAETADLLDAYLQQNASARETAGRIRAAVGATEDTVNRRPDLFRESLLAERGRGDWLFAFSLLAKPGMRAAALSVLLGLVGLGGYILGSAKGVSEPEALAEGSVAPDSELLASREETPWARYRIAESSSEGISLIVSSSKSDFTESP